MPTIKDNKFKLDDKEVKISIKLSQLDQVNKLPFIVFDSNKEIIFQSKGFQACFKYFTESANFTHLKDIFGEKADIILSDTNNTDNRYHEWTNLPVESKGFIYNQESLQPDWSIYIFSDIRSKNNAQLSLQELQYYEQICKINNCYFFSLNVKKNDFYAGKETFEFLGLLDTAGKMNFFELLDKCSSNRKNDLFYKNYNSFIGNPGRGLFSSEFKIKIQDKLKRDVVINAAFTEGQDEILIGIIREPLLEKKYEKELKKIIKEVKRADNLRLNFLKNLSYEIRTPMNAILGFSELLSLPDLPIEKLTEYTGIIRNKGKYLHTLIDDVIELSQFESGKIDFNNSITKLQPILNELFEEFETKRKKLRKDNITFKMFVPEGNENQIIYTDAGRLYQLLSNLLSNALKFTQKGRIEFGYKLSDKFIKFYVTDTGPGLNKEECKKIFNRFEEMEMTALRKYSGTGLSLTISKFIVNQMGGKIKVKSEPGKGSKFQIIIPNSLPIEKEKSKNKPVSRIEDVDWKDKVILIAEDEEVNYRFLEALLERTNAKVLRARNGREAIELCKTIKDIDIVLMDIKMPVLSGYDAIIAIKEFRKGLPIIAQTAFASHSEINKCQSSGCNDFITKPIDINLLVSKIERQFYSNS